MEKAYVSMSDEGRVGLTVGADGPGVVGDLRGSGTLCKDFKSNPELRLDINNGITLCGDCHKGVHAEERCGK